MPSERVLICGAGVAGSILAFWLAKYDFQVVVIERSKAEQKLGQGIEIEEPALRVVQLMDIIDKLNEKRTAELGFTLVDAQARSYGHLEAGGLSPTGALELMRGDLTEVLYQSANASANVTYMFETTLHSLRQTENKVIVDLENRNNKTITTKEFDLVVGADGVRSRTRQLVMGPPEELHCYKPVGACVAYFDVPKEEEDSPYSELCHFPGRRIVWIRPGRKDSKVISVYLIYCNTDVPNLRRANAAGDRQKQKEALAELYSGLGWKTPRLMEQMLKSENFYSDELAQVKLPKWFQDRVVLVGDAAWAPTPFTGEGNQLAILGGFVLAQELSRNRNTIGFEMYEKRFRPYVKKTQSIPLYGYAPFLCNPQTNWGIWIFRMIFWVLSWTIRSGIWTKLGLGSKEELQHPDLDLETEEAQTKKER